MVTLKEARTLKLEVFRHLPQLHATLDHGAFEMDVLWRETQWGACGVCAQDNPDGKTRDFFWFESIESYEVAKDLEGTELYATIYACARIPKHELPEILRRYEFRRKSQAGPAVNDEMNTWRELDLEHAEVVAWWGLREYDEHCLIRTMAFFGERELAYPCPRLP